MIRQALKKDFREVKNLIDYGSKEGFILPRTKEDIQKNLDVFFVCELEGRIIGCCALDVYSWKMAEIRSLVILPQYRKKNLGTKLVKKCIAKAKKMKIYKVLSVTKADKFFEKLGFAKCLNDQWPMFIKTTKIKGYF